MSTRGVRPSVGSSLSTFTTVPCTKSQWEGLLVSTCPRSQNQQEFGKAGISPPNAKPGADEAAEMSWRGQPFPVVCLETGRDTQQSARRNTSQQCLWFTACRMLGDWLFPSVTA